MTSILDRGLGRARALATQLLATKTIGMRNQQAIVSFTFDDFPRSAVTWGARTLENYGACGTFYAAGSMCERTIDGVSYFNSSDVPALGAAGHEIGCHTFSHVPISDLTTQSLRQELDKNAAFVADKSPGYVMCSFAYPFGAVSPFSKPLLQRCFATCRGTRHGLNSRKLDLGFLRAVRLYSHLIDEAMI
jgi:peptidoglycan/xylan/chitin deacetylase (PgdA/CDA1 family)